MSRTILNFCSTGHTERKNELTLLDNYRTDDYERHHRQADGFTGKIRHVLPI
jgi:hypothetical protein